MSYKWHWPMDGGKGSQLQTASVERSAHRFGDMRTSEQLQEHYLIERELADRLLPRGVGKHIAQTGPMRALLGLRVAAMRPRDD